MKVILFIKVNNVLSQLYTTGVHVCWSRKLITINTLLMAKLRSILSAKPMTIHLVISPLISRPTNSRTGKPKYWEGFIPGWLTDVNLNLVSSMGEGSPAVRQTGLSSWMWCPSRSRCLLLWSVLGGGCWDQRDDGGTSKPL